MPTYRQDTPTYQYLYERPSAQAFGVGQCLVAGAEYISDGVSWISGSGTQFVGTPVLTAGQPTLSVNTTAGNLNGTYAYMITYVTKDGETNGITISGNVSPSNQQVDLTNIPVSSDSRVIARNIYRKPASGSADVIPLHFVAQIADNTTTTYTDNLADATLTTNALVPRINTTGGAIYSNSTRIISVDQSTTAIGWDAMNNTTGYACTAIGTQCLTANTSGNRNVAMGQYALYNNTTGKENTAIGVHCMNDNVTGVAGTAMGYGALKLNTASSNTAFGHFALTANVTGSLCTAVGKDALRYSTANYNTGIGQGAMGQITSGANNTAVGRDAGAYLTNGTTPATGLAQGVFIGSQTKAVTATDNNSIVIGYGAIGKGSNTAVIGNSSVVNNYFSGTLNLAGLATYADNAAATTGGLAVGDVYRTSTGVLMVRY